MVDVLFFKPVFHEKIWGGRKLADMFGYDLPDGRIGECWAISAHPHGRSQVENGSYRGQFLDDLWAHESELFGSHNADKPFPLLTKILDAEDSLSVQVHPDDAYAEEHEHELGKTECWYIISADPGAYLIYGHQAKSRDEMKKMIAAGDWEHFLKRLPVKAGDFVYVPSGTVHALNAGIVALETQQSSDTTYRLYDYDRVDQQTHEKRSLHIQKSEEVITVPFKVPELKISYQRIGDNVITNYVEPPLSPYFAVWGWEIFDSLVLHHEIGAYTLCSVISGSGSLVINHESHLLQKGMHFLIPATVSDWQIEGQLHLIASEAVD
ncbi:mannose-6-phosphate isomerase, class I [Oenococcus sp.]|uniref:mannose-6-phosphate isomerase, class I n=1 Tax=Oenococcus sp. TaxID=1979414 RepID=UPI0039EB26C4